ncbi:hypothetical protein CUMW_234160 [Citrus unshiu]|uniref:Uncharacterized protein n=1 Tax=Citrus unshiu TaxID=55188 RepID=A0A2H5QIR3_CITUN|nr:hypothetical protein CUMW_234160 [Citrus unshiu]
MMQTRRGTFVEVRHGGYWLGVLEKKTHESINNRLALVMKSGKYTIGYKAAIRSPRRESDYSVNKDILKYGMNSRLLWARGFCISRIHVVSFHKMCAYDG